MTHPLDRMAKKLPINAVYKVTNICYIKACCELGYDAGYVNQYEQGKVKNQMIDKIHRLYLEKICELPTSTLEMVLNLHRKSTSKLKISTCDSIELELMSRILISS